jgi:hypothetical protein
MSLMAHAHSAVAQKGRDGASFNRLGEGYFGHPTAGRLFLRPDLVLCCDKCVFSVRRNVSFLLR